MDQPQEVLSTLQESSSEITSLDRLYDILSDHQRRRLLIALHRGETPAHLSTLAQQIANDPKTGDREGTEWIRINLYHCHLPKLDEVGLILFDRNSKRVELTESGRALAKILA